MKRMLRRKQMLAKVGFSDSTRHNLEKSGLFPARKRISKNIVAWDADEIDHWLETRLAVLPETAIPVAPHSRKGRKPNLQVKEQSENTKKTKAAPAATGRRLHKE